MLEALCGNKNVQKVLLFLFVNNKCYGGQLQRTLRTPLTPLQNALKRLEKGKIIMSYCEGKTKLYQLNPAYPLLEELERLLKKAYTLLPPQEKKLYSLVQHEHLERRVQEPILLNFWERLKSVKQLTLHAKSRSKDETGWNGKGKGEVLITQEADTKMIFNEKGAWIAKQGEEIGFNNTFRWVLDRHAGMISLEHLRLGTNHAAFLFHLAPTGTNILASLESHLWEEDTYLAHVFWDIHSVRLMWRVIGPKKNEEIEYFYY